MASLFRANVPYTRPFHGAQGAKTGLCERHTVTASQRRGNAGDLEHVSAPAPKPRTISGCRARPRPPGAARPWHLGRPRPHGFQRTESGGGGVVPPGTPPPRCHGSELGLGSHSPSGGGDTGGGGPVLCLWVCWTFKQKEECHRLHLYLVSAGPESLGPFSFAQNAAHRKSPESKKCKFQ